MPYRRPIGDSVLSVLVGASVRREDLLDLKLVKPQEMSGRKEGTVIARTLHLCNGEKPLGLQGVEQPLFVIAVEEDDVSVWYNIAVRPEDIVGGLQGLIEARLTTTLLVSGDRRVVDQVPTNHDPLGLYVLHHLHRQPMKVLVVQGTVVIGDRKRQPRLGSL